MKGVPPHLDLGCVFKDMSFFNVHPYLGKIPMLGTTVINCLETTTYGNVAELVKSYNLKRSLFG